MLKFCRRFMVIKALALLILHCCCCCAAGVSGGVVGPDSSIATGEGGVAVTTAEEMVCPLDYTYPKIYDGESSNISGGRGRRRTRGLLRRKRRLQQEQPSNKKIDETTGTHRQLELLPIDIIRQAGEFVEFKVHTNSPFFSAAYGGFVGSTNILPSKSIEVKEDP